LVPKTILGTSGHHSIKPMVAFDWQRTVWVWLPISVRLSFEWIRCRVYTERRSCSINRQTFAET